MVTTAVETTALQHLAPAGVVKKARADLEVGTHPVDVVVHVHGSIEVLEDTDRVPTSSIPLKETLVLLISRMGCTRSAALELLRECMTEALQHGVRGEGAVAAAAEVDDLFRRQLDELTRSLPRTVVRGAVRPHLAIDVVSR